MFKEGYILYFTPFYFKNGNTAKNKYFVILKEIEGKAIIANLPTRKDSIPEKEVVESGCIELPEINLNCYVISPKKPITECNKHFYFRTHIYGHQLDLYELSNLNEIYQFEEVDYEIYGEMRKDIFAELIDCLKNSRAVKRKFKKLLSQ